MLENINSLREIIPRGGICTEQTDITETKQKKTTSRSKENCPRQSPPQLGLSTLCPRPLVLHCVWKIVRIVRKFSHLNHTAPLHGCRHFPVPLWHWARVVAGVPDHQRAGTRSPIPCGVSAETEHNYVSAQAISSCSAPFSPVKGHR